MTINGRDSTYDVIKGGAIILMVLAHAMEPRFAGIRKWIYLFHMPVFFIAVGWFYKVGSVRSKGELCRLAMKRIKRIWIPFVLWIGIFLVLHDLFLTWNVYSGEPSVSGYADVTWCVPWGWPGTLRRLVAVPLMREGMAGMAGAFWFLQTLFIAQLLYLLSDFLISLFKERFLCRFPNFYVMTIFAIVSFIVARYGHWGGGKICTAYGLMHLGVSLRYYSLKLSTLKIRWLFVTFVGCIAFLVWQCNWQKFSLDQNVYSSVTRLVACSIAGWYLLESIARLLQRFGGEKWLSYVGRHTMPILIFHFLSFKIVSLLGVLCLGMPLYKIAAFPCTFHGPLWCVCYTVVGIVIPLILNWGYCLVKHRLFGLLYPALYFGGSSAGAEGDRAVCSVE